MYLPVGDCHGIFALSGTDMKCTCFLSIFSAYDGSNPEWLPTR